MSHALNLATLVGANDKLLKALITLLALRDEHLVEELDTVVRLAGAHGGENGQAADPTWSHIGRELAIIADLVADADEEESTDGAPASRLVS
jgi:hypothetical protein